MSSLNIIARKPMLGGMAPGATAVIYDGLGKAEYVVIDRGEGHHHRYVSASCTEHSLRFGEWIHGHYFTDLASAIRHFNGRP